MYRIRGGGGGRTPRGCPFGDTNNADDDVEVMAPLGVRWGGALRGSGRFRDRGRLGLLMPTLGFVELLHVVVEAL